MSAPRIWEVFSIEWEDGARWWGVTSKKGRLKAADMAVPPRYLEGYRERRTRRTLRGYRDTLEEARRYKAALARVFPGKTLNFAAGWYFCDDRIGPQKRHHRWHGYRGEEPCDRSREELAHAERLAVAARRKRKASSGL